MTRIWLVAAVLILTPVARAQFFSGPISSALGGAGRAALDPGEGCWLNPASVVRMQDYYASVHYGMAEHDRDGRESQFGAMLADGTPDKLFAGALSFIQKQTQPPAGQKRTEQEFFLAAGSPITEQLSFGFAFHHMITNMGGTHYSQDNGHFGLLWSPVEYLGLSFVGYDLLGAKKNVAENVRLAPAYALGSHFAFRKVLRLRLDIVRPEGLNPNHRNNVMTGLESFLNDDFLVRLGWQWRESADQHLWTAGLGYRGPRLSVDYSFQKDVRVAGGGRHLIDLWLPF